MTPLPLRPVLAVDLGGTQIRAAIVRPDRTLLGRRAVPTADEVGIESVIDRIVETAAAVLEEARGSGDEPPIGIGIASPGPIDPWRGVVLSPPNLAGWRNVPLADRISSALGLPAFLERDTNVAVMAEWSYGAGRGAADVIYITVSTGIGGGIVSGGQPLIGPDGLAGEVGHVVVELDGPACGCGGRGHVEAIASGTALARDALDLLARGAAPELAALARTGEPVDAELLARAADAGDTLARGVLERAWTAVGALCASLVNLLNPRVVVIGGGIAEHQPRLFDVARAELDRRVLPALAGSVRLAPAELGGDVSLIGSLPIVNDRIGDPAFAAGPQGPPRTAVHGGASAS